MVVTKKIKASTMMESIISIALISAVMVIVFPFFGQLMDNDHQLEIMKGFQLINEIEANENYSPYEKSEEEFYGEGITVKINSTQDKENPNLYLITIELVNTNNKVVYSFTEYKYRPQ